VLSILLSGNGAEALSFLLQIAKCSQSLKAMV